MDNQRLRTKNEFRDHISSIVNALAAQREGLIHVFEIVSHLPVDVDTVARCLQDWHESRNIETVHENGLTYWRIPADIIDERIARESKEPLSPRLLIPFSDDEEWVKKVCEQHEILRIASQAKKQTVELTYFTSRSNLPSAKIQSVLNDFGAEQYISITIEDDESLVRYTFPEFEYPQMWYEKNMGALNRLTNVSSQGGSRWVMIVIAALVLLAIILYAQFAV